MLRFHDRAGSELQEIDMNRFVLRVATVGAALVIGLPGAVNAQPQGSPEQPIAIRSAAVKPLVLTTADKCTAIANAERKKAGLRALVQHRTVNAVALAHSKYQASINKMTHTGKGGSSAGTRLTAAGYRWRTWGENVAYGYADCAAVLRGWMNSPGHKANILNRNFTHIGIGVAKAANGRLYWTMVLSAPRV
jgi:uncharacterized protein YkwD